MLTVLTLATALAGAPNVVLITMDTTRADAIGAYGEQVPGLLSPRSGVTPTLDGLAAEGVLFERFYAHAPTTLNSHTSLLSGRDPHEHAVPRNGYPLPPDLKTLPMRLEDEGYDTIAVVAAKALEEEMGLSTGFRVYDDEMTVKFGPMYQDRAENVTTRALAAVETHTDDKPLFLWVHYYDPHGPFRAPEGWFGRFMAPDYDGPYADPMQPLELRPALRRGDAPADDVDQVAARYLDEVHYMDHHIGVLLDGLRSRGLLDSALVVATADHGETLSEEPAYAYGHGGGVDEGVLRIPLIVWGPTLPIARGRAVSSQQHASGLAPTLETLLGLPVTLGPAGSFAHLVRPGPVWDADGWPSRPTTISFSEATRARREPRTGWNNRLMPRGVRASGFFLQSRPRNSTEQYLPPLAVSDRGDRMRSLLRDLLFTWDLNAPPHREEAMSAETLDALRALGYIDMPSEPPGDDEEGSPP